ncbi:MAG: V-type ATP synthase subunit E [Thermoplasmatota archaeon]
MGLEQIIKRIRYEADREARGYLAEAREKASSILEDAEREIRKDLEERERRLRRDLTNTRNIYISDGRRKARQAMLSIKEDLIWETIYNIRSSLLDLSQEDLKEHLSGLVRDSEDILGEDMSIYPVRDVDRRIISEMHDVGPLVSEAAEEEPQLQRYRATDLLGGFIAVNSNGQKVLDMTFHGLLDRKEDDLREIIAHTLFPEE